MSCGCFNMNAILNAEGCIIHQHLIYFLFIGKWSSLALRQQNFVFVCSGESGLHCLTFQHYAMNGLPCADKGTSYCVWSMSNVFFGDKFCSMCTSTV